MVSFTGSTKVGKWIGEVCGKSLKKVSLELGGKNPLVVCDDADLDEAVKWVCLSAFSNAGQRCAAGSRIIVFDTVYDAFRDKLVTAAKALKVGPTDDDDFGPVINERQIATMLAAIEKAKGEGRAGLDRRRAAYRPGACQGVLSRADRHRERRAWRRHLATRAVRPDRLPLSRRRLRRGAVALANDSPYGLTACIHTRSVDRGIDFAHKIRSGVAVINAGTFGSEPHMPFGGFAPVRATARASPARRPSTSIAS